MAASIVLDAAAVAQVVTYVAPGFLARVGYRTRFPSGSRSAGEALLMSVVVSLPLVALVSLWWKEPDATRAAYVAELLGIALVAGYLVARVRDTAVCRQLLERLGHYAQPDGSSWSQLLRPLPKGSEVQVELKDGRRLAGFPRQYPLTKDDVVQELYLAYPRARVKGGGWVPVEKGIVLPLSEVANVVLSDEPTGLTEDPRGDISWPPEPLSAEPPPAADQVP